MKILTSLLFVCLFISTTIAQPPGGGGRGDMPKIGKIKGQVVDGQTGQAIEYATIQLHRKRDSSLVAGGISEPDGSFLLENLPYGRFFLNVDFIGYETNTTEDIGMRPDGEVILSLGQIKLESGSTDLDEIVVTEERGAFQTTLDKKVFNMKENITSQGGSALEALSNVPSVEVDVDGNISMRGNSNVTILINGRPSGLSESTVLEQLSAEDIESVEVITNPSAKYDPDGTSGIINIVLRKSDKFGANGDLRLGLGYGRTPKANAGLGLNVRNKRVNIFSSYSFSLRNRASNGFSSSKVYPEDATIPPSSFYEINEEIDKRYSNAGKLGMDIFLNNKNTIYWSGGFTAGKSGEDEDSNVDYFDEFEALSLTTDRNALEDDSFRNADFNLGYQKRFDKTKQALDVDLNYSYHIRESESSQEDSNYDANEVLLGGIDLQRDRRNNQHDVGRASLDYVHPVGKKGKLETGYKGTLRTWDEIYFAENFDSTLSTYLADTNLNNQFLFDEQVHALYAIYGQSIKKFEYQMGLRAEQAFTESELVNTNERFENNYFSLFPSGHLAYKMTESQEIQLSFSRRINRPRTRQLNPFASRSNQNSIRAGNPFLKPEYIYVTELGYAKYWDKFSLNTSVYHRYTTDVMRRFLEAYDDGTSKVTYRNFKSSQTYGSELILSVRPYKWWRLNTTFNVYQSQIDAEELENINTRSIGGYMQFMSSMTVLKDLNLQLSSRYRAPFNTTQGRISSFFNVDFAARKKILNGKGSVGIRFGDIFNTMRFKFESQDQNFERSFERNWESQTVNFSFSYNFGKISKDQPKRQIKREQREGGGSVPDI